MTLKKTITLAAIIAAGACGSAQATVVLDFEGIGDSAGINDFYNGGTDSAGNSGTNHGINFSAGSLGLIDKDAGGSGNIANEPSGQTILFFETSTGAILNMAAGFDTGFSFFYSTASSATVTVYDGLDATGTVLGTINLAMNYDNNGCVGDPNGSFCNWDAASVSFAGLAKSINFGGIANLVLFDNITFGSATAGQGTQGNGTTVPEPAPLALLGFGLLGLGVMRKRRG